MELKKMENFEWPSERIPQGGLFHLPKVSYSKDTHDLIKLLMDEAHLTMMQRKKINYHLRNGDPLPPPPQENNRSVIGNGDESMQAYDIIMRAKNARKRSLDTIKASGAYEQQKFVPPKSFRENYQISKKRLQELMSGFKEFPEINSNKCQNKHKHKRKEREEWPDEITELLNQIYERADWLAEMEELGEGKKHRDVIQAQIAERLRTIKKIEKNRQKLVETMENINKISDKNIK